MNIIFQIPIFKLVQSFFRVSFKTAFLQIFFWIYIDWRFMNVLVGGYQRRDFFIANSEPDQAWTIAGELDDVSLVVWLVVWAIVSVISR